MFHLPLVTSDDPISEEKFWEIAFLYHNSPHLINRRILGLNQLFYLEIKFSDSYKIKDILNYEDLRSQILRSKPCTNFNKGSIETILELNTSKTEVFETNFEKIESSENGIFVSARVLLPRNVKVEKCIEIALIDKPAKRLTFMSFGDEKNILGPNFSYDIELEQNKFLKIGIDSLEFAETNSSIWLIENLFPKLISWAKNDQKIQNKSLKLVNVYEYCNLYHELKIRYGEEIIKNWPENTDPKKFVFEDIAIATYLILLWKKYSEKKQKFVDLGCGNGLLVHILTQEDHEGLGLDIRPRKIWKKYPETTKLEVKTVIPSLETKFPEVDWLIGNHSDELTPWIPIFAAQSSKNCGFFLLPCCPYEFNGQRYQRKNSGVSQYLDYLGYVEKIIENLGFTCERDRLRIPSTKRICFVGRPNGVTELSEKIGEVLNLGSETKIKVRDVSEPVRNCTKLERTFTEKIVTTVFNLLLSEPNFIQSDSSKSWNSGTSIPFKDLVSNFPKEDLKKLKNECGGLQTLLKNHHSIFEIKNSAVNLRIPIPKVSNSEKRKTKKCFFYQNHPNGCLLDDISCNYRHEK